MIEIVKQNWLEVFQIVCYIIVIVSFTLAGNYLLSFIFVLLFAGKLFQLYGKVKKSKEYDND